MTIDRIRCTWTGFPGAPGVSTFYSLAATADITTLHGFFQNIKPDLPADVTIEVPTSGDIIDETTGELTGGWSGGSGGTSTGEDSGTYPAPVGAAVTWETGVVMDAHRLRGRTFIVPLAGFSYGTDGTIDSAVLATLRGAAASLLTGTQFVVWHRPRAARAADGSRKAITYRAGGYASWSGSSVKDEAVVLRSRRD